MVDVRIAATGMVVMSDEAGNEVLVGVRDGRRQVSVIDHQRSLTRSIEGRATAIASGDFDGDGVGGLALGPTIPAGHELVALTRLPAPGGVIVCSDRAPMSSSSR